MWTGLETDWEGYIESLFQIAGACWWFCVLFDQLLARISPTQNALQGPIEQYCSAIAEFSAEMSSNFDQLFADISTTQNDVQVR